MLRAGMGLFYDLGNGQAAQGFGSVFPFVAVKRFTNVPYPLSPDQSLAPPFSLDPPFGTIVAFDPNLKLPPHFSMERWAGEVAQLEPNCPGRLRRCDGTPFVA